MKKDIKQEIIMVAYRLFALKGFESCSMNDIAKEAKVNKASIYYYFSSKEILYEQVIKNILEQFYRRILASVEKENNSEKKLYAFIYAFGENFKNNTHMAPLMLRELASNGKNLSEDIKIILLKNINLLKDILDEGTEHKIFKEQEVFVLYLMIVGTMNMYTSTNKLRNNLNLNNQINGLNLNSKEISNVISTLILNGIKEKAL